MPSEDRRFRQFVEMRWVEGDDVIELRFEGLEEPLRLHRADFPAADELHTYSQAPYRLAIAEGMDGAGLIESNGRKTLALEGPLALAVYDWLGWPMPEPRQVRVAS